MIGALLVAVAAPLVQAPEGPTAVWWTIPSEVEVGEPFRWLLEVRHPQGALRDLEEQTAVFAAGLDPSWVLLEPEPTLALPDPGREGWVRTRTGWRSVSLEPGERLLPPLQLVLADGTSVATGEGTLAVGSVLGDGDEPRAARDFRQLPTEEPGRGLAPAAIAAGVLGLLLLAWMWLRSARGLTGAPQSTGEMRLRASLAALDEDVPADAAEVRERFYELSALLREALDERAGRDRRGLTDDEWLGAVHGDEALPASARADLERFLARCAEIKYAAQEPTEWAVREELGLVRNVLAGAADREDAR